MLPYWMDITIIIYDIFQEHSRKNYFKINFNVPLDTKDSHHKDKLTSQVNNALLM